MLGLSLFLERIMDALVEISQSLSLQHLRFKFHQPPTQQPLFLNPLANLILLFLDFVYPTFVLFPATLLDLLKHLFFSVRS